MEVAKSNFVSLNLFYLMSRFMRDNLLSELLEALIVIRGLIVQKTKLISDCNRLLKELLDSLLLESSENKRQFIRACIHGLQIHGDERKGRTCLVWRSYLSFYSVYWKPILALLVFVLMCTIK